ncbi:hypothetical protein [Thermoproteus tenax]|uniref:hypothetical protein n=1 Tax=Thermoproteus tenax TaxID=2271 RepID=UPI001E33DC60|nr:hypothetical protein [Thermoproteus tenax]
MSTPEASREQPASTLGSAARESRRSRASCSESSARSSKVAPGSKALWAPFSPERTGAPP